MAGNAELRARVTLDPRAFRRGLARVRVMSRRFGSEMGPVFRNTAALAARAGAVIGAATVGGFIIATKAAADYTDTVDKMAARTGLATETVSALSHGAELAGGSIEGFEKSIAGMQRSIDDLGDGLTTSVDAFGKAGVALEDLQGLNVDQQFERIAKAVGSIEDPTKKAAVAMQIFGARGGRQIIPLLTQDFQALRQEVKMLGIMVSPEQAEAGAKFKDQLTRLKGSFLGLALAKAPLESLTRGLTQLTDGIVRLRESGRFDRVASGFVGMVNRMQAGVVALVQTWDAMSPEFKTTFGNLLKLGGGFLIAWKVGFLGVLVRATAAAVGGLATILGPVLIAALTALSGFIAGLAIGKTLERSFNLSGLILKVAALGKALFGAWQSVFSSVLALAGKFGIEVAKAMIPGKTFDFTGFGNFVKGIGQQLETELKGVHATATAAFEAIDSVADKNTKTFMENKADAIAEGAELVNNATAAAIKSARDKSKEMTTALMDMLGLGNLEGAAGSFAENLQNFFNIELDKINGIKLAGEAVRDAGNDMLEGAEAAKRAMVPFRGFVTFGESVGKRGPKGPTTAKQDVAAANERRFREPNDRLAAFNAATKPAVGGIEAEFEAVKTFKGRTAPTPIPTPLPSTERIKPALPTPLPTPRLRVPIPAGAGTAATRGTSSISMVQAELKKLVTLAQARNASLESIDSKGVIMSWV